MLNSGLTFSLRLDGNPIKDRENYCNKVAECLALRGQHVVAGGDLVLHLGNTEVRWHADSRPLPPPAYAIKELRRHAEKRNVHLQQYEDEDPKAQTENGKKWLSEEKKKTAGVLDSKILKLYRQELSCAAALKDQAEAEATGNDAADDNNKEDNASVGDKPSS